MVGAVAEPAGLGRRVGAFAIDATALAIPLFLGVGLASLSQARPPRILQPAASATVSGALTGVVVGLWAVGVLCYFALLRRQTLGYLALGIRLADARSGGDVGRWRALARFLIRIALYLPFVVPGLVADLFTIWTRRRQNLIDLICRTVVVRT
ncbi:MAG TPA: RDD family protein [Acidimicrobiales bacterium]|nr:RDD family protein [Acidimicrobiales bacterium]